MRPHVDEIVVAGITESRVQKSDRRDAYGLKLRTGALAKRILEAPREFGALRFQLLQNALKSPSSELHFYAFDLLHLDGFAICAARRSSRARKRCASCWRAGA